MFSLYDKIIIKMLGEDGRLDSLAGCAESREIIFRQWLQIASGLLVFAMGVHLTIYANIGLAPWDCLVMGISYHTLLNAPRCRWGLATSWLTLKLIIRKYIFFTGLRRSSFLRCLLEMKDFTYTDMKMQMRYWLR